MKVSRGMLGPAFLDFPYNLDNPTLEQLSDSAPVFPVASQPVAGLTRHDEEPMTVKEWKDFFSYTRSDQGDADCSSDTSAHSPDASPDASSTDSDDDDSPISAYVVYYGRKMGVFKNP